MKYSVRCSLIPRPRKDGSHTIRMRVSWNGRRVDHYLAASVLPTEWDERSRLPRRTQRKALREVEELSAAVGRVFDMAHVERRIPTAEEVKGALGDTAEEEQAANAYTVAPVMEAFLREQSATNDWTMATATRFRNVKKHLVAWRPDMRVADFDEEAVRSFVSFMYAQGLINTTVDKNLTLLRWFLRWCKRQGYTSGDSWEDYKPKFKETDNEVIYLDEGELSRLIALDLSGHPYLEKVRDMFLFCCFTGLRYSDLTKLAWSDVADDCIRVVTKKTNDQLRIELNSLSAAIIEKYRSDRRDALVFPVISNQKMNAYIKTLGKMAHISRPIRRVYFVRNERHETVCPKWQLLSTHAGRRTFVVTALSLEIPAEVIMRWTGHSDHKAMKPYIAIVDKLKEESMAKFDTFLKGKGKD